MLKQADLQNVLLVEDDAVTAKIHGYFLRKLGFSVDSVSTGSAALEKLGLYEPSVDKTTGKKDSYSAVVLDLGLPDINGAEVLSTLRKREKGTGQHLPVIIVTAHGDPKILNHFKTKKKADYGFIKPVRLLDFKQTLQTLYYKKVWLD